jgi:hypothetical protein
VDRVEVYQNELLLNQDILNTNKDAMIGLAKLTDCIIGNVTSLNNLPCVQNSPPALNVLVGPGEIYQYLATDATTYGTLPADPNLIQKQGILLDQVTLACPAPATVGFSVDYLIQVTLTEQDINGLSRAFYNSSNPATPIFTFVNQTRNDLCNVQVKAGTPAATGTQVPPAPDSGFIGAYVVTVAHGQTTIINSDISVYPNAPFIVEKLQDKISEATGDARYVRIDEATFLPADNLIIGGDFSLNPWQRGTSFVPVADGEYTADRWLVLKNTTAVCDVVQSADAPSPALAGVLSPNCYRVNVTTADASIGSGEYLAIAQRIEGYNFTRIAQNIFCVSMWVKTNKIGTYCVAFRNSVADRSYVAEFTVSTPDVWTKYTFIITASPTGGTWDYTNGIGLEVCIVLAAGATYQTTPNAWQTGNFFATSNQVNGLDSNSNYFSFNLVQVEGGSIPRQFFIRTITEEIGLCQRFFVKTYNIDVLPGTPATFAGVLIQRSPTAGLGVDAIFMNWAFPVSMRAVPTVTPYSPFDGASNNMYDVDNGTNRAASGSAASTSHVVVANTTAISANANHDVQIVANAEL